MTAPECVLKIIPAVHQGTEVMFYQIIGGGHAWPVGYQYSVIVLGKTCRDIDANEVIWAFFQKHSR